MHVLFLASKTITITQNACLVLASKTITIVGYNKCALSRSENDN